MNNLCEWSIFVPTLVVGAENEKQEVEMEKEERREEGRERKDSEKQWKR